MIHLLSTVVFAAPKTILITKPPRREGTGVAAEHKTSASVQHYGSLNLRLEPSVSTHYDVVGLVARLQLAN